MTKAIVKAFGVVFMGLFACSIWPGPLSWTVVLLVLAGLGSVSLGIFLWEA